MLLEKDVKFKVGDIVEAFGLRGEVMAIHSRGEFPIEVQYGLKRNGFDYFTRDGKLHNWHNEPSLKLIERPKKKVKVVIHGWMNIYPDDLKTERRVYKVFFGSKEDADSTSEASGSIHQRIACIEIKQEIEVEE